MRQLKKSQRPQLLAIFLILFLAAMVFIRYSFRKPYVLLGGQKFHLQVADTNAARAKGLSGQENLGEREAMLFVFNELGKYSFWMKEMKFGLDFIFINNQKVVDLVENVLPPQPGEKPQSIWSKAAFDKVLEVNQGTVKDVGLQIGDQLDFFLTP